jgi:ABC-2 type transport system ATP-binding protein
MTGGDDVPVIEAIELTARRHRRRVLDAVNFQVRPGQVTGLLGLPGAGKTTVLRRMLQLDRGGGRTLYDGRGFRSLTYPMRSVGVMLDPLALHPARTVTGHLRLALSADPGAAPGGRRERIAAVLDVCGLTEQARTRIAELTEGMTVRLALAQALLGDPDALLLDEPDCGLEPEGLDWLAAVLRAYAAQGRCVLVTGQDVDTMLGFADRLLVLDGGRLLGQRTARQAARELSGDCVIVRTPQVLRLAALLVAAGAEPTQLDGTCLEVRGLDRARIGDLAFRNDIPLHELSVRSPGEDPVVAALEACRPPAAMLPVQAPPTARVPEHPAPTVAMPFIGGLGDDLAGGDLAGDDLGDGVDGIGPSPAPAGGGKPSAAPAGHGGRSRRLDNHGPSEEFDKDSGLSNDLDDGGPNVRVLPFPVEQGTARRTVRVVPSVPTAAYGAAAEADRAPESVPESVPKSALEFVLESELVEQRLPMPEGDPGTTIGRPALTAGNADASNSSNSSNTADTSSTAGTAAADDTIETARIAAGAATAGGAETSEPSGTAEPSGSTASAETAQEIVR